MSAYICGMTIPQSVKAKDAGRIPGAAAVPNCIEIGVYWSQVNSKVAHCYLHGRNLGTFTADVGHANTLMTDIGGAWSTRLGIYAPTSTSLLMVSVRDMTNPTFPIFNSTGPAVAGGSTNAAMPPEVALVMTENVNVRGRGAKGRIYLPCWATNADAGGGVAIAAVQTAINQFGTDLVAFLQGISLVPCVAKPGRAEYIGVTGTHHALRNPTTADVTSYTCRDLIWDAQRRRSSI